MLTDFIEKKMKTAIYKLLKDGSFFGEISGLKGVWASGKTLESCRVELKEVLEDWLVLALRSGDRVPGLTLNVDRRMLVKHA